MSDRPSLCILLVGASGVFGSRLAEQRVVQVVAAYDPDLAALVRSHTTRDM